MNIDIKTGSLKEMLVSLFFQNRDSIRGNSTPKVQELQNLGLDEFEKQGFPHEKMENWRFTDIKPLLENEYVIDFANKSRPFKIDDLFTCHVYDLDTYTLTLLNGWFVYSESPLKKLANGTIIGSLAKAMEEYPELIDEHIGSAANINKMPLAALNSAFIQDGLFVYVPDGVEVEKPIQLVNVVDAHLPIILQPRHLLIAGKNSKVTLVHCDHSLTNNVSFSNTVMEIVGGENAEIDHYKVQNKGSRSALFTTTCVNLYREAKFKSKVLTLNGNLTRNCLDVKLLEEQADADLYGLYLVDKTQHVDNQISIDHAAPNCTSNQLFKGILDDQSRAVFSGLIHVWPQAQQTKAYQNNKNLLLTDEAKANTQPRLEIYADDVKCSHGATVGQLDAEAMFYLRSRGIGHAEARKLMMLAFADEIVQKISILPLKNKISSLVEKRLSGELSICDQCLLHCADQGTATFRIDPDKL